MAYDRGYRRERERSRRRGRDIEYGWGVPIRGMYDYSLDYGGLAGPETDDSETMPPYESERPDWTGPRPRYERDHWAAAEPAGESRYREHARGRGGYAREFGTFHRAFDAARARAQAGYAAEYGETRRGGAGGRRWQIPAWDEWPGAARRGASVGPGRDFGGPAGRYERPRDRMEARYGRDYAGRGWVGGRAYDREYGRGAARRGAAGGYGDPYGASGRSAGPFPGPAWAGYAGYRFRDGSGSESRGRGAREQGYEPDREGPPYRSRGPRGRWGSHGGRVAPGGD